MQRRRRGLLPLAALAAGALLLLAGCGSAGNPTVDGAGQSLFGPFAGYVWTGQVQQLSAVVVVPGVIAESQEGTAGTWIGAQGPTDPRSLSSPFFQVGVNEVRLQASHGVPGQVGYYGFWSSTGRGFHPVFLFQVYPGDRVKLVMTLTRGHWQISADDETQRETKTLSVSSPSGATYDQAIWQQEDVSDDAGGQLPYPEVSTPTFSRMKVDSSVPRASELTTTWMSTKIGVFGPSRLRSDQFVVREVHPSAAALRYQEIANAEYLPSFTFSDDAALWSAHTPQETIKRACLEFAQVLQQAVVSYQAYRWPADVKAQVRKLGAAIAATRVVVLKLSRTPTSRLRRAALAFQGPTLETERLADQIRQRLKVPRLDPSGLLLSQYVHSHGD